MGERATNAAVLVYLVFTTLWLVMAALGLSGVQLAQGAVVNSIIQGVLAGLSSAVLAARLRQAHVVVGVLGLGIWLTPLLVEGLPPLKLLSGPKSSVSSQEVVEQRLAEQWAMPYALRPPWAQLATLSAINLEKYPEAPEVRAEMEQRSAAILNWMREHSAEVAQIREELARKGLGRNPRNQSVGEFEKALVAGLSDPSSSHKAFAGLVLEQAEALGLQVKPTPLTAEQKAQAVRFAQGWLHSHPTWIPKIMSSGSAYTGDPVPKEGTAASVPDPESEWRHGKAAANPGKWIVLLGLGFAWVGRATLVHGWEPAHLPGWTLQGLNQLVRPGGTPRILAGLAMMASSFALVFVLLAMGWGYGVRKLFAGVMMLGAVLVYSGLTLSDGDAQ